MKYPKIPLSLLLLISITICCQKENMQQLAPAINKPINTDQLTIQQAQKWLDQQTDTSYLHQYPIRWQNAKNIITKTGNRIILPIAGQPTFQNVKQGYRQLSFQINPHTKQIEAKLLEIIPDAIYFQGKRKVSYQDFTGRILEYSLDYRLVQGKLYANGQQIGELRAASQAEKAAYTENKNQLKLLGNFEQRSPISANGKIAWTNFNENCSWYQSSYVDAEGIFTVYTERICTYSFSGGGISDYNDQGVSNEYSEEGGGGSGSSASDPPPPPTPSELPGETQASVDPKKMMECFSSITSPNAAYQVKIFVQEPLPGTFFNIGPNAFGHVAIQLTKAAGNQLITQTLGFYPTGTGLDKLISKSRMIDNGGLSYTMSATYWTSAQDFQNLIGYLSDPPKDYHYTDFNCAAFVYQAGQAANIPIPDPTTQIGFSGPGGAGTAMTPQGMAQALSRQKANNPSADISKASGRVSASKGECK